MKKVLVITGPTATGKSNLAIDVANKLNGEIVSADSMQIYKNLDIATAKVPLSKRKGIKHHLVDSFDFNSNYSVANYQKDARKTIEDILSRNKLPILTGGTGLYIKSVIDDVNFPDGELNNKTRKQLEETLKTKGIDPIYLELKKVDPDSAELIDINNHRRIIRALEVYKNTGKPFSSFSAESKRFYETVIIGLNMPRDILYERINERIDNMISDGLIDETKTLIKSSFKDTRIAKQALGYKEITEYLENKVELEDAINNLKKRTRNYAKRQLTWFNKDERIVWVDSTNYNNALKETFDIINSKYLE